MNESNDLAVGQIRRTGMGHYAEILAMDGEECWVKFSKPGGRGWVNRKVYPNSAVARWPISKPPIVPDQRPEMMFVIYQIVREDSLKVIRVISPEFTSDFHRVLYREIQRPGYLVQAIRIHASSVGAEWYDLESYEEDGWDEDEDDDEFA